MDESRWHETTCIGGGGGARRTYLGGFRGTKTTGGQRVLDAGGGTLAAGALGLWVVWWVDAGRGVSVQAGWVFFFLSSLREKNARGQGGATRPHGRDSATALSMPCRHTPWGWVGHVVGGKDEAGRPSLKAWCGGRLRATDFLLVEGRSKGEPPLGQGGDQGQAPTPPLDPGGVGARAHTPPRAKAWGGGDRGDRARKGQRAEEEEAPLVERTLGRFERKRAEPE